MCYSVEQWFGIKLTEHFFHNCFRHEPRWAIILHQIRKLRGKVVHVWNESVISSLGRWKMAFTGLKKKAFWIVITAAETNLTIGGFYGVADFKSYCLACFSIGVFICMLLINVFVLKSSVFEMKSAFLSAFSLRLGSSPWIRLT